MSEIMNNFFIFRPFTKNLVVGQSSQTIILRVCRNLTSIPTWLCSERERYSTIEKMTNLQLNENCIGKWSFIVPFESLPRSIYYENKNNTNIRIIS